MDESRRRSSLRELTGYAVFILATDVGAIQDRLIRANTELELASMYKGAFVGEWEGRFDALMDDLRADGTVETTVRRMSDQKAKELAIEIYELSWVARTEPDDEIAF